MIIKEQYLEAKKIVDEYELQLKQANVIKSVCPKCKYDKYYWHSYYRECMNCGEEYFKGQTVL
jgi:uncharacterized protein (DUF983 family)